MPKYDCKDIFNYPILRSLRSAGPHPTSYAHRGGGGVWFLAYPATPPPSRGTERHPIWSQSNFAFLFPQTIRQHKRTPNITIRRNAVASSRRNARTSSMKNSIRERSLADVLRYCPPYLITCSIQNAARSRACMGLSLMMVETSLATAAYLYEEEKFIQLKCLSLFLFEFAFPVKCLF